MKIVPFPFLATSWQYDFCETTHEHVHLRHVGSVSCKEMEPMWRSSQWSWASDRKKKNWWWLKWPEPTMVAAWTHLISSSLNPILQSEGVVHPGPAGGWKMRLRVFWVEGKHVPVDHGPRTSRKQTHLCFRLIQIITFLTDMETGAFFTHHSSLERDIKKCFLNVSSATFYCLVIYWTCFAD